MPDSKAIRDEFGKSIDAIVAGTLGTLGRATPIIDVQSGARIR